MVRSNIHIRIQGWKGTHGPAAGRLTFNCSMKILMFSQGGVHNGKKNEMRAGTPELQPKWCRARNQGRWMGEGYGLKATFIWKVKERKKKQEDRG